MNKKKKIIGMVFIICMVMTVCAGYCYYRYQKESKHWRTINREENIDDILYAETDRESGDICIVVRGKSSLQNDHISPDGYIYTRNFAYKERDEIYDIKIEKAQVDVYDLETREKVKSYDLGAMVEQYAPGGRWWNGGLYSFQQRGGDLYFGMGIVGEEGRKEPIRRIDLIYINFETDEIAVKDVNSSVMKEAAEVYEECDRNYNTSLHYLLFEDEIGIKKANGINGTFLKNETDKGYWCLEIYNDKDALPEENSILYSKFPGLKDYQGKDGEKIWICLMEDPTPEEVVTMLLEEGEEISFEGWVLPAESSIDGQEHEIHSFEEYEQWKKYEE